MVGLLCILLSLQLGQAGRRKISDVYLLLPQTKHVPNDRLVRYQIEAYDGCYRWTTADSRTVALTEDSPGVLYKDEANWDSDIPGDSFKNGRNCFSRAILEPIATVANPPVTLVTATEAASQNQLRCEVKVGRIDRLEILTTVKSIRVGDYQKLLAQAFDSDRNTFSSLEGLRFRWNIAFGMNSVAIPKLKDSLATASEVRRQIESANYHSDIILVEGKATGVANVTLTIEEPGYEHVPMAWSIIYVSEPFTIVPSTLVYLPPRAYLPYELFKLQNNQIYEKIQLPSSGYKWLSMHPKIFEVNEMGEVFTQDTVSKGLLQVQDALIEQNAVTCEINVVAPDRLQIVIEPFEESDAPKLTYSITEFQEKYSVKQPKESNFFLISGEKYKIYVRLFQKETELYRNIIEEDKSNPSKLSNSVQFLNDGVYIPINSVFELQFLEQGYWEILSVSENGAEVIAIPHLPPNVTADTINGKVNAKLVKVKSRQAKLKDWIPPVPIADTQEIIIVRRVQIIEPIRPVLLPYFAVLQQSISISGKFAQEYHLHVQGGSGSLKWESEDNEIVSVKSRGVVFAHKLGTTRIKVYDTNNILNYDSIEVEVSMVEQLKWSNPRKEVTRGFAASEELYALASGNRTFHNCTSIAVDWDLRRGYNQVRIGEKLHVYEAQKTRGICEIRALETLMEGQAIIQVNLLNKPSEVGPSSPDLRLASEEARVGVFKALSIGWNNEQFQYEGESKTFTNILEKNAIVLTPGAHAVFDLVGGVEPWSDLIEQHRQKVTVNDKGSYFGGKELEVKVQPRKLATDSQKLEIVCPDEVKQTSFTVKVYNKGSQLLLEPGQSDITIAVACMHPQKLKLSWLVDESSLIDVAWKAVPMHHGTFRRTFVSKFDTDFWILLNNQELKVKLDAEDDQQRPFLDFSTSEIHWKTDDPALISYLGRATDDYRTRVVQLSESEGPVTLSAELARYKSGNALPAKVTNSLKNELVRNVELTPQRYSLYMHLENSLELGILYGSGVFEVSTNSTDTIDLVYDGYRKILVSPRKPGKVHVIVNDKGLNGSFPAASEILISGLGSIELRESQLIEIKSTANLQLTTMDTYGNVFNPREHVWMGLALNTGMNSDFRVIQSSKANDEFVVTGSSIGEYPVFAFGYRDGLQGSGGQKIMNSNTIIIDIFPPLQLIPPVVLLLPSSKFTLGYSGGPEHHKYGTYGIDLVWTMDNEEISTIEPQSRMVSAHKIGNTPVHLKMMRAKSTLTQASGLIRVQLATSVGIQGMYPGRSVIKDSVTRLIAVIMHNGEYFTDGVADIDYSWKANMPQVYHIHKEGEMEANQIGVTGHAVGVGQCDISVQVEINYPPAYKGSQNKFSTKVTAVVEAGLHTNTPSHRCHSLEKHDCYQEFDKWRDSMQILMPPKSAYIMRLNKEGKFAYTCENCREDFLKVYENGKLVSGGSYGQGSVFIQNTKAKGDFHTANVVVTDIVSILVEDSFKAKRMALGMDMSFNVIYQDAMAHSFHRNFEYGINVGLEVSNSHVLQAVLSNKNATLSIRTQYTGRTYVKVFLLDNPLIKDIFEVSVSSIMKPVSPIYLHLGGEVQFRLSQQEQGSWSVMDPHVLSVNQRGLAQSISEGTTNVIYREKNSDLSAQVHVVKIKGMRLGAETPAIVTNYDKHPEYQASYKIPIRLFVDSGKTQELPRQTEEVKQNIEFKCGLPKHSDLFRVESELELLERQGRSNGYEFNCILYPLANSTPQASGRELELSVSVSSKYSHMYTYQESFNLNMLPKFGITGNETQIILSGSNTSGQLVIGGSCDLLKLNVDTSLVRAFLQERDGQCTLHASAMSIDEDFRQKRVEVEDRNTGQKEVILVSYFRDPKSAAGAQLVSIHDLLVALAMFALIFIVFNVMKRGQTPQMRTPAPMGLAPRYGNFVSPAQRGVGSAGPSGFKSASESPGMRNVGYNRFGSQGFD